MSEIQELKDRVVELETTIHDLLESWTPMMQKLDDAFKHYTHGKNDSRSEVVFDPEAALDAKFQSLRKEIHENLAETIK